MTRRDELYHFGILGMRWGVRRYQNPDGSLTPAGRKRLNDSDTKFKSKNPEKAKKAEDLRSKVRDYYKDVVKDYTKALAFDKDIMTKDLSTHDFLKSARRDIDSIKKGLQKASGDQVKVTEEDAIRYYYTSRGMEPPANPVIQNVANMIHLATALGQINGYYEDVVKADQTAIDRGKKVLAAMEDVPLEDFYKQGDNMYYDYWDDKKFFN